MKLALKDYQADAVAAVLENLDTARLLATRGKTSSVALTAATGAGKTVMAAAVIEALFFGNADFDVPADPTATVLWFTSDPSLNEQTRHRIMQASDRIGSNRLRVVESTFSDEQLRPGTVYFLNSQKLSKNARLVRGGGAEEDNAVLAAPDMRARTFWEVLGNTVEDPGTTLYVILDEAHVGMNTSKRDVGEKSTIVTTLINGEAGAPPVPIVLGISATIERYRAAMERAANRTTLPDVVVDPVRVQESGLLKDSLILSFPAEVGTFDTVLLRHAVARTKEASDLWSAYQESQGGGTPVEPLLVVQVPNKPSEELLSEAVHTVLDEWPELSIDNLAHVFGEGTDLAVGDLELAYVPPQDVAERAHIRVLLAKDAISTGWDCPRAEVLVSFRPAQDLTHITQLLGRMVRTPLARRIPGDDRLNAVECILPMFNRSAAEQVARAINGGDGPTGPGPVVVIRKQDFRTNAEIDPAVWDAFDRLPSQTVPRRGSKPVSRFTAFAAALAKDGVRPGAYDAALGELVQFLRGKAVQYESKVEAQVADVLEMTGERIVIGLDVGMFAGSETFALTADDRAVEADYRVARRILTPQLASAYADALEETYDDGYFEAHLRTAAIARVGEIVEQLDAEADRLFARWDAEHRVAIKSLSDESRAQYDELRALAGRPLRVDITRPEVRTEAVEDLRGNLIETAGLHLLADGGGQFPIGSLLDWERKVLDVELDRCVSWYRNPSRASSDALAIAYRDSLGTWRRLCPDFIFFQDVGGVVKASIVDPHGTHLSDALPKLRGLAAYAEEFASDLHRIEAVAEVSGVMRVLDVTRPDVRAAIAAAESAEALYESAIADNYS
ncbi:DEAD/DEAH box helicase [Nocardioides ultimimeridianus]